MKHVILMIAIFSSCGVFSSLYAQENTQPAEFDSVKSYEIDEMVVTGTRTLKRIIDIPYSVERISNYEFRYERKNSITDVLGGTPGLFFQNRYGNHDVRISIRGFGSRSNSGIRGVRILLDDIPESEPDGQTRIEAIDFHSIGRIEIVKGNASSLYTNAPGGVINFINDIDFTESHIIQFNEVASFGTRNNGMKLALKGDGYKFLSTYTYHTAEGYRPHSNDNWNIVNSVYETHPNDVSKLTLLLYYVDGLIKLPGSLMQHQYEKDPFMGNPRDIGRDAKRVTKKGRIGIRYNTTFGKTNNNELELTGYGTIKYFERTAATYRFMNRNGIGGTGRWIHKTSFFDLPVEFSIGADVFHQYGPIEEYQNYGGKKGEPIDVLTDESIDNVGAYFLATVSVLPDKVDLMITGRQDKVIFDQVDRNLEVRNAKRVFEEFTPKIALNYKITPVIGLFTSFGYAFDSPAGNEMENY
ncbi:MAG: TonB-dependent receptor, partial [Bacteriovoracaceae bacterium]